MMRMTKCKTAVGLGLALGTRILLLLSLAWVMRLTEPLFTVPKGMMALGLGIHGAQGQGQ